MSYIAKSLVLNDENKRMKAISFFFISLSFLFDNQRLKFRVDAAKKEKRRRRSSLYLQIFPCVVGSCIMIFKNDYLYFKVKYCS